MVGSAIWRTLELKGYSNLIGKTSQQLDLRKQSDVYDFYSIENIEVVIDAAARVGGILANNNYPYDFLMQNMQIQNNLIDGANKAGVEKFIFLGSSCIYPKLAPQPLKDVGTGKDISIKTLALTIQKITGHKGKIIWDSSKPDGTPRKLMDISKMKSLGWKYHTELEEGIKKTYRWYLNNFKNLKELKL